MRRLSDASTAKAELRRDMRALRRSLPDRDERSHRLWSHVEAIAAVREAAVVMVFDSIVGEPVTAPFVERLRAQAVTVVFPEDEPKSEDVDVVIVPGVAFTPDGGRLGQGGGWYDRFLVGVRADCVTIGVCFIEQVLDGLPVESHDVSVDLVMTDVGACRPPTSGRS